MKPKRFKLYLKKGIKWCGTILMTALTWSKPVKRDRWLFGTNGSGMVIFAIIVAVLAPFLIWGGCWIAQNTFKKNLKINEVLLTNYDTDVTELRGTIRNDSITLNADSIPATHTEFWSILSQYTDPGNLPSAKIGNKDNGYEGYILALICALAGVFCLSGLAVSSFISFINRTTERWKQGLIRYDFLFNKYVVIIGCNRQTANLVKLALTRPGVKYVLIMTRQNVEQMRMRLDLDLDRDEEERVVFYYAERTSREDIAALHIERALDIFILGEDVDFDNEEDHDEFNISCLENISEYLKELKHIKLKDKKRVHVNLEYQSTFTAFKYTHIYRSLDKNVEFIPFNIHEIWAKKVLVDNFAVVPIGKKGEVKLQNYLPIDSPNGIKADDDKTVHLVIVGMNQMGTAMGVQAALLAHFPNAHRDRNLRTTITFIDDQAIKEGEFLRGRFATMFDLCRYRVIEVGKDTFDKDWINPLDSGRYQHLRDNQDDKDENFMDIQWEFIQGNVASDEVREYLQEIAEDVEHKVTTIAICFNHPQNSVAAALYLPEMVYRRAQQILVYQQNSFDLADKIAGGEKVWKRYEKLKPFGMVEGSYTENAFENSMAKILYYLYANGKIKNYREDKASNDIDYSYFEVPDISSFGVPLNADFAQTINDLWAQQGIVDKLSNIDMVDSIPMKLRSIGINMDNLDEFVKVLSNEKTLEFLAKSEHTRWLTERITMGYRPLDNSPIEWEYFCNPSLSNEARKNAKNYRKDKSRAHLDICSNTMLNVVDPGVHYNDIAVISYIPQLIRYREWLNIMRLAKTKTRDSVSGKLLMDFIIPKVHGKRTFALQLVNENGHKFWIMDTVVSQRQWKAVMGNNPTPENYRGKLKPVINVSKLDIDDFVKVLRKRIGLYMDLPSLREWKASANQSIGNSEFKKVKRHLRVSKSKSDDKGPDNVRANARINKHGIRLFNMLGNVWEWTSTENTEEKGCFFFCGGSWRFKSIQCDLDKDYWNSFWKPILKSDDIGFRLVWRFDINGLKETVQKEIVADCQSLVKTPKDKKKDNLEQEVLRIIGGNYFVPIKTGYFVMGTETNVSGNSFPETWTDQEASVEETPHHFVKINSFKIASVPVTQELWNLVMDIDPKTNPSEHFGLDKPQTNVSWTEIVEEFIKKLNDLTGKKFRLPTEAEWEYVAKGAHLTEINKGLTGIFEDKSLTAQERHKKAYELMRSMPPYPKYGLSENPEDLDLRVHSTTMKVNGRTPIVFKKVGNKIIEAVWDMNGNVWEWVADFYQTDFYNVCILGKVKDKKGRIIDEYLREGYITNPECVEEEYAAHVFRGGSWRFDAKSCRNTSVNFWISSDTDDDLGFRLALDE